MYVDGITKIISLFTLHMSVIISFFTISVREETLPYKERQHFFLLLQFARSSVQLLRRNTLAKLNVCCLELPIKYYATFLNHSTAF